MWSFDFIVFIVEKLVDDAMQVYVLIVEGEKSTVIELRTAREDIGKVIGKQGRIAKAIRTLLSAVSVKTGKHAILEIID